MKVRNLELQVASGIRHNTSSDRWCSAADKDTPNDRREVRSDYHKESEASD